MIIQGGVVGAGSGFGAPGNLRITGDVAFNGASNVAAGDWPNIVEIGGELGHRDSVVLTNAGTFSGLTSVGTIRLTNMAALTALPLTPVLASVSNVVVENTGVQQIGCLPGQVVELRLVNNPALDIIDCASPQDVASLVVLSPGPAWAGVFWPIQLAPLGNLQVLHNGTLLDGLQARVANGATVSLVNMHLVDCATVFDGSVTFLASLELRQTNITDLGVLAGLATVTNAYLVTDNPFLCGSPNADELLALLTPPPSTVDTSLNCQ